MTELTQGRGDEPSAKGTAGGTLRHHLSPCPCLAPCVPPVIAAGACNGRLARLAGAAIRGRRLHA